MMRHSTKKQTDLTRASQSSVESIEAFCRNHLENVSCQLIDQCKGFGFEIFFSFKVLLISYLRRGRKCVSSV